MVYFKNSNSEIELFMIDSSLDTSLSIWDQNITCSSSCSAVDYTHSDFESSQVHFAANLPSEGKVLMMVLGSISGNIVGSMKTTQTSQQLALGSLSADSNSMTWVSVYSASSSYSELIKYDSANNNFTVYQQTGISYVLQHIDSNNNDNWLGLGKSSFVSNTTQACMSNVTGLTVSTTMSGLDDASSSFSIAKATFTQYSFTQETPTINSSITSAASDMDCVYRGYGEPAPNSTNQTTTNQTTTNQTTTNQTNEGNDDGLSAGEIIGLTLGPIFGLVLVIGIVLAFNYIYRKKTNRHGRSQENKISAQQDDHAGDHAQGHIEEGMESQRSQKDIL